MEVRWLEAFIAVAEELHFGNAAIRLRMAQSPLSQVIRKLERSLDTELFIRSTRSVDLTPAGHAFLPHARAVLEEIELAQQSVKVPDGVVYGKLIWVLLVCLTDALCPALPGQCVTPIPKLSCRWSGE